jgi:hypothetical protein
MNTWQAARAARERLVPQPGEVKRADYFNLAKPPATSPGTRQVLTDALSSHIGFVHTTEAALRLTYPDLIA